jgi:hypothetical protein
MSAPRIGPEDVPDVRRESRAPTPFVVIGIALLVGCLLTIADEHIKSLHGVIPFGFFIALIVLDKWAHRR